MLPQFQSAPKQPVFVGHTRTPPTMERCESKIENITYFNWQKPTLILRNTKRERETKDSI